MKFRETFSNIFVSKYWIIKSTCHKVGIVKDITIFRMPVVSDSKSHRDKTRDDHEKKIKKTQNYVANTENIKGMRIVEEQYWKYYETKSKYKIRI